MCDGSKPWFFMGAQTDYATMVRILNAKKEKPHWIVSFMLLFVKTETKVEREIGTKHVYKEFLDRVYLIERTNE